MASQAHPEFLTHVLERTGYLHDGSPGAGLWFGNDLMDPANVDKRTRYDAVFQPGKVGAAAVYELAGSACIYFAALSDPEPDVAELARRHHFAWNHGLAPMLWFVTPSKVILYDCFSRPTRDQDAAQHIIKVFSVATDGLAALSAMAGREQLESGAFWATDIAQRIDRRQRVDTALVRDISLTVRRLTQSGLALEQAHVLIGRSIYVAYLIGRGILRPAFLRDLVGATELTDIFESYDGVYRLFEWVEETFNGDLFPLVDSQAGTSERNTVDPRHVELVRRLLAGEGLDSGQLALWPYRFDVIPVELLSSIYERFTHTANSERAQSLSTHYTPLNVVDLVLTQALDGIDSQAKVLDLACGSGVFLVEAFRRLVARHAASGEFPTRALIRRVLHDQIFGVDINPGAVQIAAFSLYLAALELDEAPEPPEALRFERLIGRNLFVADAFDEDAAFNRKEPFSSRGFGLIVGNPPWTRSALTQSANNYCESRGFPLARRTPDQAFLWRFADFSNEWTRIAVVMAGKPFFAYTPQAQAAKRDLLLRYSPILLIDLGELHQASLFPSARAPALIFFARAEPGDDESEFAFVAIERTAAFSRHGILEIAPERVQRLRVGDTVRDRSLLMIAKWAGGRDALLVERLRAAFPSLQQHEKRFGLAAGQGFQRASAVSRTPQEIQHLPLLGQDNFAAFRVRQSPFAERVPPRLHRPRRVEIFRAPVVVTTRFPRHDEWCRVGAAVLESDHAYDEAFFGISFRDSRVDDPVTWAHYFSGILNSAMATYFLFLTSAVWGVERNEVRAQDIRELPVPLPEENPEAALGVITIAKEAYDVGDEAGHSRRLRSQLDNAVFDLYGLSAAERILVKDLVEIVVPLKTKGTASASKALTRPATHELERYARCLTATLAPLLDALQEREMRADVFPLSGSPLHAVYLRYVTRSTSGATLRPVIVRSPDESLESIGASLYRQLMTPLGERSYTRRVLRAYVDDAVVIAKPAQRRYWTESAALQDADAILAEDLRL